LDAGAKWWVPSSGSGSGFLEELVQRYWTQNPYTKLRALLDARDPDCRTLVDLGCSVGGGVRLAWEHGLTAVGVDIDFPSVLAARQLALGAPSSAPPAIPDDRLLGRRPWPVPSLPERATPAECIIGDVSAPPLRHRIWDIAISFNVLDVLDDPVAFPAVVRRLLSPRGRTVSACPYLWTEHVADRLRSLLPPDVRDSARAAECLYEREGFVVEDRDEDLPWLIFKQPRQFDAYSVHYFVARRADRESYRSKAADVKRPRRLDVIGFGNGGPSHLTLRANELLARADRVFTLTAAKEVTAYLGSMELQNVVDLSGFARTSVDSDPMGASIMDCLVQDDDGWTNGVLVVESDSPLAPFPFFNHLAADATRRGWTVAVHPAVSSVNTILAHLDAEALAAGLCVCDVHTVIDRSMPLVPSLGTLLLHLGTE
jgi:SAM-dependent methyltransferase